MAILSTMVGMVIETTPIRPLRDIEREYILDALTRAKGNKKRCAGALGITVRTLYNKLRGWGVPMDYGRPPQPVWTPESAIMAKEPGP